MIVTTERLQLTPVTTADADDLVLLHSDPNVAYWYAGAWSTAHAHEWCVAMVERWRREGIGKWMARLRCDGTLVGRGGLSRFDLEGEQTLELGWTLRDTARGHGYATELGRAALGIAFEGLQASRVVAFTEVHNHASQAVMRRLGMRPRRCIRRRGLVAGADGVHEDAPFALYDYDSACWTSSNHLCAQRDR
jgi:RimJ/RimL family protein N-acetyltransferase